MIVIIEKMETPTKANAHLFFVINNIINVLVLRSAQLISPIPKRDGVRVFLSPAEVPGERHLRYP